MIFHDCPLKGDQKRALKKKALFLVLFFLSTRVIVPLCPYAVNALMPLCSVGAFRAFTGSATMIKGFALFWSPLCCCFFFVLFLFLRIQNKKSTRKRAFFFALFWSPFGGQSCALRMHGFKIEEFNSPLSSFFEGA